MVVQEREQALRRVLAAAEPASSSCGGTLSLEVLTWIEGTAALISAAIPARREPVAVGQVARALRAQGPRPADL